MPLAQRNVFINVNSLGYSSFMFADALVEGRDLWVPGSNGNALVAVDAQGKPTAAFEIFWMVGQPYAVGTYGIDFVGTATVDFPGCIPPPTISALTQDPATKRTTGTATFAPGFSGNITMAFRNPVRADGTPGLTEWHLYRPTTLGGTTPHNRGEVFSRPFLGMLAPFAGYRTLDLSNANENAYYVNTVLVPQGINPSGGLAPDDRPSPADTYLQPWSARRLPTDPIQGGVGANEMAIELLIAAANSDPGGIKGDQALWFNVRDYASPEWIDNFFYAVRYGTDGVLPYTGPPGSSVTTPYITTPNPQPQGANGNPAPVWAPLRGPLYVEWSNEVWNFFAFPQWGRNVRLARQEVRDGTYAGTINDLNWDNIAPTPADAVPQQGTLAFRRVGRQIKYLSDRGKAILAPGAYGTTFFPVLMGQAGNPGVIGPGFDYLAHALGQLDLSGTITHAGCAFYEGAYLRGISPASITLDQYFGLGLNPSDMAEPGLHVPLCKRYNVQFAAYEGGKNCADAGGNQSTWDATNSDPREWRLARNALDHCFALDPVVNVLSVFDDTGGGWAICPTTYDLVSPLAGKYRAIVAGAQAWTANPAGAVSPDPLPPLATYTGVTVTAPAPTVAAGSTATFTGTVAGTNAPLNLLGWYATAGAAPGGAFTAPPPANVARQVTITASSTIAPAVTGSATVTIPAVVGAPPPVLDPSFEEARLVGVQGGGFVYGPTIPGSAWAYSSGAGVTVQGFGFADNLAGDGYGPQFGFLQGIGSMSQALPGWVAGTYQLTLLAAQRTDNGNTTNSLQFTVDGQVVGTFTPNPVDSSGNATHAWVAWTSPAFTVAAGTHTLALAGTVDSGYASLLVDNINVIGVGSVPPVIPSAATIRQLLERLHILR